MTKLGDRVKDKVSGFTGIVTGRTEYLNGCTRVVVEPEGLHEGKPIDSHYFDEMQVEVIKENVIDVGPQDTGGPKSSTSPPRTGSR